MDANEPPRTPTRNSPAVETVTFSMTGAERRAALRAAGYGAIPKPQRRIFTIVGWIWLVCGLLRCVAPFVFHETFAADDYFATIVYGGGGLFYLLVERAMLALALIRSRETYPIELSVASDAIRPNRPAGTSDVRWRRVDRVDETPTAIVIGTPFRPIVVPKRAFGDDGVALAAALEGKRQAVRSISILPHRS